MSRYKVEDKESCFSIVDSAAPLGTESTLAIIWKAIPDARELAYQLLRELNVPKIETPGEFIPRCPHCGNDLSPSEVVKMELTFQQQFVFSLLVCKNCRTLLGTSFIGMAERTIAHPSDGALRFKV